MQKIIQSEKSEALMLIKENLPNKKFIREIYDCFADFYVKLAKNAPEGEVLSYMHIARGCFDLSAPEWLGTPEFSVIEHIVQEHWHFFVVLLAAPSNHGRHPEFEGMSKDVMLNAYRCWLLCYLKYCKVPSRLFMLLELTNPFPVQEKAGLNEDFAAAFFVFGANRLLNNRGQEDDVLIRQMCFYWESCPDDVREEVAACLNRNRRKRSRKEVSFRLLLRKVNAASNKRRAYVLAIIIVGLLYGAAMFYFLL